MPLYISLKLEGDPAWNRPIKPPSESLNSLLSRTVQFIFLPRREVPQIANNLRGIYRVRFRIHQRFQPCLMVYTPSCASFKITGYPVWIRSSKVALESWGSPLSRTVRFMPLSGWEGL